jgi:hypothetical protein
MNRNRVLYCYGVASIVAVILIACFALAELSAAILLFLPLGVVVFVLLLIDTGPDYQLPRAQIDGGSIAVPNPVQDLEKCAAKQSSQFRAGVA